MPAPRLWIGLGMSALGLLVGLLAGLSLSPVVGSLLSVLFAFAGSAVGRDLPVQAAGRAAVARQGP
jgi:hypothetical protein